MKSSVILPTFPLRKIIDFAMTKPSEVDEAYRKFFGSLPFDKLKKEWEELFLEWLIFDYKQKTGTSFLIEYILRNPDQLDDKMIDQFEQIAKTHIYSMFETQEIKKGEWFILEDLHTGKAYKVYEKKGTLTIQGVGTIPGRIAEVDNHWYLVFCPSCGRRYLVEFLLPLGASDDLVGLLEQSSLGA